MDSSKGMNTYTCGDCKKHIRYDASQGKFFSSHNSKIEVKKIRGVVRSGMDEDGGPFTDTDIDPGYDVLLRDGQVYVNSSAISCFMECLASANGEQCDYPKFEYILFFDAPLNEFLGTV